MEEDAPETTEAVADAPVADEVVTETPDVETTDEAPADVVEDDTTATAEDAAEETDEEVATDETVEDAETETAVEEDEIQSTIEDLPTALRELAKTRKEAAENRVKFKELEAQLAASGEQTEFKQGWEMLGGLMEDDPEAGLALLADLINETGEPEAPPTIADVQAAVTATFQRERDRLDAEEAKARVNIEVTKLGYDTEADAGSPEYARYQLLRSYIAAQPEGEKNLTAAHGQVNEFAQTLLDQKLAELAAANTGVPAAHGGGTAQVAAEEEAEPVSAFERIKRAEEESIRFYEAKNASPQS